MKGNNNSQYMNKSERVLVHVRMRPFTEDEMKRDNTTPIETFDTGNNVIVVKKDYEKKNFNYDSIFHYNSIQKDIYEKTAKNVVDSVLKGYNGTIFAYGQTGTGKTHTMVGDLHDENNRGIIPRTFQQIFETIQDDKEYKYNILLSFIQIYLETIQDLLEPSNENIRIREDPDQGVYLEGVQWIKVKDSAECENVFFYGEKNRATASTKMNAHSSRSHAIMIVKIEKSINFSMDKIKELTLESSDQIKTERGMTKSMLFLVDLAGSERIKKTKAEAIRLEEAKKINYSLLVLGNCIQSLTDPKCSHISYRDSKLTRLLQESLGGNAKTSLIVTISPSGYNLDETVSSLQFGQRAMKVQNKPIINKTVDYQALSIKLQEDLDKLSDEFAILRVNFDNISEENNKFKSGDLFLDMQRKSIANNLEEKESMKSTFSISQSAIDDIKERCQEEINKLESFYDDVLKNKIDEHETILHDIDKVLYDKENEIDKLKLEFAELNEKNLNLEEITKENEKELEDLKKNMNDLMNELEDFKKLNESNEQLISNLKNENKTFREFVDVDKESKLCQTDDNIIDDRILKIINDFNITNDFTNSLDNNLFEKIIYESDNHLKNKEKLLKDIQINYDALNNTNEELLIKINSNELQIKSLENKINSIIIENDEKLNLLKKDYEEELVLLNLELIEARKNKGQILQEKEELFNSFKNKDKNIEEQNIKINNLDSTLEEMKNVNKSLENKIFIIEKENLNHDKLNERKIKELESDLKNLNINAQSYFNLLKFSKNSFIESENVLSKNINNIRTGINNIQIIKQEFHEIEKVIKDFDKNINSSNNNFDDLNNNIETFSNNLNNILQDSENLEILKSGKILFNSNLSSPSNLNINNIIKNNNYNFDKNKNRQKSKSKSPERCYTENDKNRSDMINTDNLKEKFKEFNNLLENISDDFIFSLNSFFNTTNFFSKLIKVIIKSYNDKIYENKNTNLEYELTKKNESYLKNSIICIIQKSIDNTSTLIPITDLEDIILRFNNLSNRLNESSPPELNKYSIEIIEKLNKKINLKLIEKDLEVENLNEKIIYYLREIEILKKNEKNDKSNSGTNLNILKLQSQLKLKEEEIQRLNSRLEEHLKTIKQLTSEVNSKSSSINLSTSGISNEKKDTSGFSDNLQKKMSLYEEEINQMRLLINDQKNHFEANKSDQDDIQLSQKMNVIRKTNYLKERIKKNYEPFKYKK